MIIILDGSAKNGPIANLLANLTGPNNSSSYISVASGAHLDPVVGALGYHWGAFNVSLNYWNRPRRGHRMSP